MLMLSHVAVPPDSAEICSSTTYGVMNEVTYFKR